MLLKIHAPRHGRVAVCWRQACRRTLLCVNERQHPLDEYYIRIDAARAAHTMAVDAGAVAVAVA